MKRILTLIPLFPSVLAAQSDQHTDPTMAFLPLLLILLLGFYVLGVWGRIFVRAGHPRWHSLIMLVPLVNLFVAATLVEKAGYSTRWVLPLIIFPFGGLVGSILLAYAREWPAERREREAAAADAAALKGCATATHANLQDWLNQSRRKHE